MDSEACTSQWKVKGEDPSRQSLIRLDELCGGGYHQAGKMTSVAPPKLTDETASLGPITPDCDRENGDFLSDFKSPLSLIFSPPKEVRVLTDPCKDYASCSNIDHSPCTPKGGVFDPFAPGPDELAWAPLCKKYLGEARLGVARRLNFDSSFQFALDGNCVDLTEALYDEEKILESVYGSLLEAIVLEQTGGVLASVLPIESACEGLKTPTLAPLLNGVAETCPGAPVKAAEKLRNINVNLCRKLEF